LKKKLDALSSKNSKSKVASKVEEAPNLVPQHQIPPLPPLQSLQPLPMQNKSILGELSPEDIKSLKAQLGFPEPLKVPQEIEEVEEEEEFEEEPNEPEPSEEDLEQFKRIQMEIARLQNTGAFRVEVLYQQLGINANLSRIATALEKLTNGKR